MIADTISWFCKSTGAPEWFFPLTKENRAAFQRPYSLLGQAKNDADNQPPFYVGLPRLMTLDAAIDRQRRAPTSRCPGHHVSKIMGKGFSIDHYLFYAI